MAKHTAKELQELQALPLEAKVSLTMDRIEEWVEHFGVDGVYVSFSGGKDSTVLLDICRKMYPDIRACFIDTGLEYPEIREFVKGFDNVDIIKPKMNFKQVIQKYGYPFISKEASEVIEGARKYLNDLVEDEVLLTPRNRNYNPEVTIFQLAYELNRNRALQVRSEKEGFP